MLNNLRGQLNETINQIFDYGAILLYCFKCRAHQRPM